MNIYLDIETVPGQTEFVQDVLSQEIEKEKLAVKAPSNYKDAEKISAYIAEKHAEIDRSIDERLRKTSLDGAYGQIIVAAIAIDDAPPAAFTGAEPDILQELFDAICCSDANRRTISTPCFIGHNIAGFDLRFIRQRAMLHGIKPPVFFPENPRPWDESVFDTMTQWAGYGNRIGLEKLCRVFGIPGKGNIDGSKVWDYVQAGRLDEVIEYCKEDVLRVRALHQRMTFAIRKEAA